MIRQNNQEYIYKNVFNGNNSITAWHLIRNLCGIPLSSLMFPIDKPPILFDETLPFNCDLEYVLRRVTQEKLRLRYINYPGVYVNLHSDNETRRYNVTAENMKLLRLLSKKTNSYLLRLFILANYMRLKYGRHFRMHSDV